MQASCSFLTGAPVQQRQQLRAGRRSALRAGPGAAPRPTAQAAEAKELLERAASKPEEGFDARAFRRSLNTTGRYTRKPSNDPASLELMEEHGVGYSTSGLVAQMQEANYTWVQGEVTVKLAQVGGGERGAYLMPVLPPPTNLQPITRLAASPCAPTNFSSAVPSVL